MNLLKDYIFDEENKVWYPSISQHSFNYSDGDEIENRIYEIVSSALDRSITSSELSKGITDWASKYHLSALRANLLRPLASMINGKKVLEIGAGCGAITRYLGELGADVTAVEGSPRRAQIAALRCQDLDNVKVVIETAQSIPKNWNNKFDIVLLIGVLEYAQVYPIYDKNLDPVNAFLAMTKRLSSPNGSLIIAIENQLGLKYFAGAPEDHSGIPMYGINDFYRSNEVICFGKYEITKRLKQVGYKNVDFYLPFPDYKLPVSVIAPNVGSNNLAKLTSLAVESCIEDAQCSALCNFSQEQAWHAVFRNNLHEDLTNSFLILANKNDKNFKKDNSLAWHYSSSRSACHATETSFYMHKNDIFVHKDLLYPNEKATNKSNIKLTIPEDSLFYDGQQWLGHLSEILSRPNWNLKDVVDWTRSWLNVVRRDANIPNEEVLNIDTPLPGNMLDATPYNLVKDKNGKFVFYDLEWNYENDIPLGWLFWRGVFWSLTKINYISNGNKYFYFTNDLFKAIAAELSLNYDDDLWKQIYDKYEKQLQKTSQIYILDFNEIIHSSILPFKNIRDVLFSKTNAHKDKIRTLSKTVDAKDNSIAKLNQQISTHKDKIRTLSKTVDAKDNSIAKLNQQISTHKDKIRTLSKTVDAKDNSIAKLNQQISTHKDKIRTLSKTVDAKDNSIAKLNQQISTHKDKIRTLSKTVDAKDNSIAKLNQCMNEQEIKINDLITAITDRDNSIFYLNKYLNEQRIIVNNMLNSSSWLITKPYRFLGRILRADWPAVKESTKGIYKHLESIRFLGLFLKFFVSLKHLGIKQSIQKVKNKIKLNKTIKQLSNKNKLTNKSLSEQRKVCFDYNVKVSIICALYNTPESFLREMIESVLEQTYSNWELCLVDASDKNHSQVKKITKKYAKIDKRIIYKKIRNNKGISGNNNIAIKMSQGEFLGFLDHDDTLTPDCIFEVVSLLNKNNELDVIYTDQDKIDESSRIYEPFFKPDWSPDYFRGVMYVGHFLVVRKTIGARVNWFDSSFDCIQDYEFLLRVSEITQQIGHIHKILYHWRAHSESIAQNTNAKGDIANLQKLAVTKHLKRLNLDGKVMTLPLAHRVQILPQEYRDNPLVSIIIPTKNRDDYLKRCIDSIIAKTDKTNYEILIMDNGSDEINTLNLFKKYSKQYKHIRIISFKQKFNFSKINNLGVEHANGTFVVFLNNDTEILTDNWIKNLLFYVRQDDVGIAGALLVHPDDTVQHAGCVLGFRGTVDHVMRGWPGTNCDGYFGSLCCAREVSAVTGACIMISKKKYEEVGGFNIHFGSVYQDIDLCLKVRKSGSRVVYTPTVKIKHYESVSRGNEYNFIDRQLLIDCWKKNLFNDPYYNRNFRLDNYGPGHYGYEVKL